MSCFAILSLTTWLLNALERVDWKPNFVMKCRDCDHEYQKEVETCTECGGEVRPPNKEQLDYARVLLESENRMGNHSLKYCVK